MSTDGTDLRWRTRAEPVLRPFPLPQSQPPARGWPFSFISELFTSWSATNEPPTSPVAVAPLQPRRPVSLKLTIPGTAQSSQAAPPQSPSSYSRSIPRDRKSLVGPRRYPSSSRSRMLHRTSTSTTNASSPILSAPHPAPAPVVGLSVLPPELWRRILRFATQVPRLQPSSPSETTNIEFLPPHIEPLHLRRTKRNLVLVCSLFRTLATPFLYEYLVPENSKQTTGLLKLFAARPEFGGYVRRIAFAVVGYAHDVHVHMSCIREVLHRTPGVASAHVLYLSGNGARSGLPEVLTTVEHGETGWRWKALEWTDGSVNEPRAMDRFLGQCPLLEQLTLTGNVVAPLPLPAPTHRRWSSEPLRPRGSSLTLHSLHRLVLRDTHPATLALVASWTLPALTHLTLILNSAVSFGAAHALIARYARSLKFLRLEARHLPCEHVTSLLALCTEVEAIVVPLGTLLPRMERLQTLGWVRGMVTYGMEDLDMLDQRRLPMLETLVAVESTRFALSRREIAQFNMQFGRRLMWQDCNGDLVD